MDCWAMKLSNLGNVKWVKNYGGRGWDRAKSVLQTIDGNFIIAGFSTSNSGDVRRNNGDSDAWIVKLDSDGNIVWEKNYGGSEDDYANSIKQTTDGGYIIAGSSQSTDGDASSNQGSSDIWVFKIVPQ